jgi:hypothetical protein
MKLSEATALVADLKKRLGLEATVTKTGPRSWATTIERAPKKLPGRRPGRTTVYMGS